MLLSCPDRGSANNQLVRVLFVPCSVCNITDHATAALHSSGIQQCCAPLTALTSSLLNKQPNRNATNQFDPKWRPSRQQCCRTSTELQAVPLTMGHEHEQGTTFQQNCCCTVTLLFTYHSYWDCQAVHMQSESICCCYVVAIWLTFPAGVFLNQTT